MKKTILFIPLYLSTIFCFSQSINNSFYLSSPFSWHLASIPQKQQSLFPESSLQNNLVIGFNRAKISWYSIDPSFFFNSSSTYYRLYDSSDYTSHYTRLVYIKEIYPNYFQPQAYQSVLNIAYYPNEKGEYNYETRQTNYSAGIDSSGALNSPETRWGGIFRYFDKNIFTTNDLHYLGIWLMDPFVYDTSNTGGTMYINIGNLSEDILKDSQKSCESDLPSTGTLVDIDTTIWGRVPTINSVVNVFTDVNYQDVGLDGLNNGDERLFFHSYLDTIVALFGSGSLAYQKAYEDPSSDHFHDYLGSDYNNLHTGLLDRYKKYNGIEGNSSQNNGLNIATTSPDNEDINKNNFLDTAENYIQFKIRLKPDSFIVGQNFLADKITTNPANGDGTTVTWYKFLIPLNTAQSEIIGNIPNIDSANFIRIFLKGFSKMVILRFFDLAFVTSDFSIGIDNNAIDNLKVLIYPNPAHNNLNIYTKSSSTLEFMNIQGQIIEKTTLTEGINSIDIANLANGMYILKIKSDKGTTIKKLIKQ